MLFCTPHTFHTATLPRVPIRAFITLSFGDRELKRIESLDLVRGISAKKSGHFLISEEGEIVVPDESGILFKPIKTVAFIVCLSFSWAWHATCGQADKNVFLSTEKQIICRHSKVNKIFVNSKTSRITYKISKTPSDLTDNEFLLLFFSPSPSVAEKRDHNNLQRAWTLTYVHRLSADYKRINVNFLLTQWCLKQFTHYETLVDLSFIVAFVNKLSFHRPSGLVAPSIVSPLN